MALKKLSDIGWNGKFRFKKGKRVYMVIDDGWDTGEFYYRSLSTQKMFSISVAKSQKISVKTA